MVSMYLATCPPRVHFNEHEKRINVPSYLFQRNLKKRKKNKRILAWIILKKERKKEREKKKKQR